jgi:phage shock protein PspC (stress-responsive transcriptional regulator)
MKKKLYKIKEQRMICGVCAGIAEYFDVDPSLVRIGWLLLSFAAGTGLLAYIIAAIILPEKSEVENSNK